jgi:hypothetical protein
MNLSPNAFSADGSQPAEIERYDVVHKNDRVIAAARPFPALRAAAVGSARTQEKKTDRGRHACSSVTNVLLR